MTSWDSIIAAMVDTLTRRGYTVSYEVTTPVGAVVRLKDHNTYHYDTLVEALEAAIEDTAP